MMSAFSDAAASLAKVMILPPRSAMTQAFLPGTGVASRGSVNFTFGNALTMRQGAGGSGEPFTFDVVQSSRFSSPNGLAMGWLFWGADSPLDRESGIAMTMASPETVAI